jgi:hypothetical protein
MWSLWRRRCGSRGRLPDKHFTVFVNSQLLGFDDFDLQVLKVVVVKVKPTLERTV